MSTDTTAWRSEIRPERRTTAQLLAAAAQDSDAVSVFGDGTCMADTEAAIFIVKGKQNILFLQLFCERHGLLTLGKPVEG